MKSLMKMAAACAVVMGFVALSACETIADVTEEVLMACEDNPQGCKELLQ